MMETKVVITIDTEPDNLWVPEFRENPRFSNISELPKLQRVFDRFGARPTYLTSFSVVKSAKAGALKDIARSTACEIGTHLHAPETPPITRQIRGDGSYLHQYSPDVQREKLSAIHETIAEAFGKAPVSYRAGRYSLDGTAVSLLAGNGYLVDTSVTPGISWENDGGTNFKRYGTRDYYLAGAGSGMLEVPVSIRIDTAFPGISKYLYLNTPNWTHAEGVLRRIAGFDIVWLDPSFNGYDEMRDACERFLSEKTRCLNIMFHSSVIIAGGTPYTPAEKDVKNFFERLERLLEYLLVHKKLEAMTLKEFYDFRRKSG